MSEQEFWNSTPAELKARQKAWKRREQRADARTARICATLANCHRDPEKRPQPFSETDFMPKTRAQIRREERANQRANQRAQAALLKAMAMQPVRPEASA